VPTPCRLDGLGDADGCRSRCGRRQCLRCVSREAGAILAWLASEEAFALDLGTLEDQLSAKGQELLARVLQDYEDLRAQDEAPLQAVVDAEGAAHGNVE
jgi:hypothetical protein